MKNRFYFAYGSNMNPDRILERIPHARVVGKAYINFSSIHLCARHDPSLSQLASLLIMRFPTPPSPRGNQIKCRQKRDYCQSARKALAQPLVQVRRDRDAHEHRLSENLNVENS